MFFKMKFKKGLSQVVSVTLLILLTIVMVGILWTTLDQFILEKLRGTSDCYGIQGKVILDNSKTCYNSSSKNMSVYLELKEIEPNFVLISISSETESKVYKIYNESREVEGVYSGNSNSISLPSKEGGKLYIISDINYLPEKITISPNINGKQCEATDSISSIQFC